MPFTEEQILDQLRRAGHNVNDITEVQSGMLDNATPGMGTQGNLDFRISVLDALKGKVKKGDLKISDYAKVAPDLTKSANNYLNMLTTLGSREATMAKSFLTRLEPYVKTSNPSGGQGDYVDFKVPFSREEYGQLSEDVLPTKEDFEKGLISRDSVPFDRSGIVGGGEGGQSNIPVDINLGSDRGRIELEGEREQQFAQGELDKRAAFRKQGLDELATLLSNRVSTDFNRAVPELAEQANMSGVFRSTGFGNSLAKERSRLAEDMAFQVGQQGLRDRDLTASGMQDIADARLAAMQAGLGRELSLADFERNRISAQEFADANKPKEQGKSSGEKWMQGIQAAGTLAPLVAAPFTGGASLTMAPAMQALGGAANAYNTVSTPGGAPSGYGSPTVAVAPDNYYYQQPQSSTGGRQGKA